jgi:hypothetical protein
MIELLKEKKTISHPQQATAPSARTHQKADYQLQYQLALNGVIPAQRGQPATAEKLNAHWQKKFLISPLHGFHC